MNKLIYARKKLRCGNGIIHAGEACHVTSTDWFQYKHGDGQDVIQLISLEGKVQMISSAKNFTENKEETMWDEPKTSLTIKRGQFIIGTVDKNTELFSTSKHPAIHHSYKAAEVEAKRLAAKEPRKKFAILEVKGLASAVDVVVE